jgi:glucan phosphoethanolaminetransferase (alkaline phosphatase superfamily)
MGDFLTYNAFISLLNAKGFVGEAFIQFNKEIVQSVVAALILGLGIAVKPRNVNINGYIQISYPVITILAFTLLLFYRGGDGSKGLPTVFTPIFYSNLYAYEALNESVGDRKDITIQQNDENIPYDIILIIDESVSGNYLDINTAKGVYTALQKDYNNINIYNYGYAASITNCSAEVNHTLKYGGTRNDYIRINSTMPSIWKYARHAGLRTIYIDAQRTGGHLHNNMSEDELNDIDEFIQFDDTPVRYRDMQAADKLAVYINNNHAEFIILNKIGAHFPVHDKFPDEFTHYKPILPRGNFINVSDVPPHSYFNNAANMWDRYRNSYKNTLLWNVGNFFEKLLSKSNLNNAVVIYTSDHGQDLHERGNPGKKTHCSSNPYQEEGVVPLLILEGAQSNILNWNKNIAANKNKTSHYNIFPTLLLLMKYDLNSILNTYGTPLNEVTNDNLTFNTRFHSRLGKKPVWIKINPDEMLVPDE